VLTRIVDNGLEDECGIRRHDNDRTFYIALFPVEVPFDAKHPTENGAYCVMT